MPVNVNKGETENEFISRCVSEEVGAGKDQDQAVAICYSYWDKENMSLAVEDTSELIEPKPNEGREQYIRRCVPTIYKPGGEYDQRIATAMCADRYENSNTLLNKKLDSFSSVARKIKLYFGDEQLEDTDPCWPGYEAIGTKDMDGREVPNCVPISEPK
jgi:hypothetical protein